MRYVPVAKFGEQLKINNIVINISDTQYAVVEEVAEELGWHESNHQVIGRWLVQILLLVLVGLGFYPGKKWLIFPTQNYYPFCSQQDQLMVYLYLYLTEIWFPGTSIILVK